jgi:carboxymethylenebutenolidase
MKYLSILLVSLVLASCGTTMKSDTPPAPTVSAEVEKGATVTEVFGDVSDRVVATEVSEGDLKGYFVRPKNMENAPGIVMIHEWWGLNETIREMARVLANQGYQVFAIDLYGEVATTPEKARELATAVRSNPDAAVAKMKLATAYLKTTAKAPKIASLGWCFGGQQSLNLSLAEKLDATVIYYGNLVTDKTKLASISQPVLWIFGETDTSVKVESVKEFDTALDTLGIKNDINIYPGVGHAFANPTGANFSKPETLDAWGKTVKFLEENLK